MSVQKSIQTWGILSQIYPEYRKGGPSPVPSNSCYKSVTGGVKRLLTRFRQVLQLARIQRCRVARIQRCRVAGSPVVVAALPVIVGPLILVSW